MAIVEMGLQCQGQSGGGTNSKLSPSLRKRRAASLVAEALWNIQMEEDSGKQVKEKKPGLSVHSDPFLDDWKSARRNGQKQSDSMAAQRSGTTTTCFHLPTSSRKLTNTCTTKVAQKPMASVVPLVKTEDSQTHPSKQKLISSLPSTTSSQVLLLPISLDSGARAAVPVLALHPSSVSLDFMDCLNASTLVNVALSSTKADLVQRTCDYRPHNTGTSEKNFDGQVSCEPQFKLGDHNEPLTMKFQESSTQSGVKNQTLGRGVPSEHDIGKSSIMKDECQSTLILPSCLRNSSSALVNGRFMTSAVRKEAQSTQSMEFNSFVAYSPSSESSSSLDLDDSTSLIKPMGRRKMNINLRPKAAPPPGTAVMSSIAHETCDCGNDNNGWTWEGKPYKALVFSMENGSPVTRYCYPSMRRKVEPSSWMSLSEGGDADDIIMVRDCVIMRADDDEPPYVAKVAALWQQPSTRKMMISLLWFYRPEHIGDTKVLDNRHGDDELFASKHLDEISVECVEDKCYVLTYNQYCRYMADSVRAQEHAGAANGRNLLPTVQHLHRRKTNLLPPPDTSHSLVFFCRKLYDIKSHRLLKTFPPPTTLFYASGIENYL